MPTPVIQPSFGSGEISPSLWGRVDLAKYRVGAAKLRNFFVDYKGGATSRPGMKFVGKAFNSNYDVRLVRFQFNTEQTYVLEFGHLYIRVIKDGGYVLETAKNITAITQANPGVVTSAAHGFANGDWVYLSAIGGMTQLNSNTYEVANVTANTFTLKSIYTGVAVNTSSFTAYTAGGTAARYYTVTTNYEGIDLALLKFTQSADVLTITHPEYEPGDLTRTGHASWILNVISIGSSLNTPTNLTVTTAAAGTTNYSYQVTAVSQGNEESIPTNAKDDTGADYTTTSNSLKIGWSRVTGAQFYNVYRAPLARQSNLVPIGAQHGLIGSTFGNEFVDSNIQPDYTITPPLNYNPFANGAISDYTIAAAGAGYVQASTSISVADPNGSGVLLLPVIKGGALVGVIIKAAGKNYTAPVVTVTGVGAGAAVTLTMTPLTGNNPSVSCYFQQRKWYAAPANYPETIFASKPGAFTNFDYSSPINSGDSIENVLASQEVNDIRWLVPMQGGLVVLTGAGAWQISGGSDGAPITATGIKAEPQAFNGCAQVQPLVVGYDILYVQAKGSVVRDLSYNFFVNVYTGTDLTILSNHLFAPYEITEWVWAEEPHKLVWAVRSDGTLLSCAFLKEQEVVAWSPHDTQGLVTSITSIQEGIEDVVYMVVERLIGGVKVKYIEKLTSRTIDLKQQMVAMESDEPWRYNTFAEDAFCVDSGLTNTLSGRGGTLNASSTSGAVILTNSTSVFTIADIGSVIRCMKGVVDVTGYTSGFVVTGTWRMYPTEVYPETTTPIPTEDWTIQAPFTSISGLDHLEGQTVKILGDGSVFPDKVVTNGTVAVNQSISRVVVGLGFTAQLQTLDLELESAPKTIQGKRKKLSQMTVKVAATRGLSYGPAFDALAEVKDRTFGVPLGMPIPLLTGQFTVNNAAQWDVEGRVCIEQSYPLPAAILAVAPDVDVGN